MDGTVGNRGERLVVGDDDKGLPELVAQVKEQLMQFFLVLRVKRAGRFVSEDDGRVVDQGACHGDALFLTTREFVWLVGGAVREFHEVEQLLCPLTGLSVGESSDIGRYHDVLNGRELR